MEKTYYTFLLSFMLFCGTANGQIELINLKIGECKQGISIEDYDLFPKFINTSETDSSVTFSVQNFSNCIGIYNPRIEIYGRIINLRYDDFQLDSISSINGKKEITRLQTDCICCYETEWTIGGTSNMNDYIFVIQGQLIQNQKERFLNNHLSYYKKDGKRLINAIDKYNRKQGRHENGLEEEEFIRFYRNDSIVYEL